MALQPLLSPGISFSAALVSDPLLIIVWQDEVFLGGGLDEGGDGAWAISVGIGQEGTGMSEALGTYEQGLSFPFGKRFVPLPFR